MSNILLDKLSKWFQDCPEAVIAFSGGVDSSLVAYLSRYFLGKERTLAIISASPSLKLSDLDLGKTFCLEHDIPLRVVETRELLNPDYAKNPSNRCYFCKHTLYTELFEIAEKRWILNGTNTDDLKDYRPGLLAADKFKVRSPLSDCGLNKNDVRELSKMLKLESWDKPASPCMSSRIPYGEMVTLEKLQQIEAGESILEVSGFPISRLRHFGDLARIEVPKNRIQDLLNIKGFIADSIKQIGFDRVEFDEDGFISGKLNEVLNERT